MTYSQYSAVQPALCTLVAVLHSPAMAGTSSLATQKSQSWTCVNAWTSHSNNFIIPPRVVIIIFALRFIQTFFSILQYMSTWPSLENCTGCVQLPQKFLYTNYEIISCSLPESLTSNSQQFRVTASHSLCSYDIGGDVIGRCHGELIWQLVGQRIPSSFGMVWLWFLQSCEFRKDTVQVVFFHTNHSYHLNIACVVTVVGVRIYL